MESFNRQLKLISTFNSPINLTWVGAIKILNYSPVFGLVMQKKWLMFPYFFLLCIICEYICAKIHTKIIMRKFNLLCWQIKITQQASDLSKILHCPNLSHILSACRLDLSLFYIGRDH